MHGVGGGTVVDLLDRAGFGRPVPVTEQFEPDPEFPTVAFPNPEEPGAMDLSLATAARAGADVVVVNDPDADRLAVAIPDGSGGWRMLRGDEVGVLLADAVLADPPVVPEDRAGLEPVLACSLVSSQQLGRMAAAAGIAYEETLTGFKWIARAPGPGPAAPVRLRGGAGLLRRRPRRATRTASAPCCWSSRRAAGARRIGHRAGRPARRAGPDPRPPRHPSALVPGRGHRRAGPHRRHHAPAAGVSRPTSVGGRSVERFEDLATPAPGRKLPPGDVLVLHLDGARVIVRPSGTEPKLKCYLEVVVPVTGEVAEAAVRGPTRRSTSSAAAMTALLRVRHSRSSA